MSDWIQKGLAFGCLLMVSWRLTLWFLDFLARKRTLSERLVFSLGRWARFWVCVYAACDKAVLYYRIRSANVQVEPECELERYGRRKAA